MNEKDTLKGSYIFSASPGQERLWFLKELNSQFGPAYNIPALFKINGFLNIISLQKSMNKIVERHEILRTALIYDGTKLLQVIKPNFLKTIRYVDCTIKEKRKKFLESSLIQESSVHFNFTQPGIFDLILYKFQEKVYYILINIHHIISDGISLEIFVYELFEYYSFIENKIKIKKKDLEIQFADFVKWNEKWISSSKYLEYELFWKKKQKDFVLNLTLPKRNRNIDTIIGNNVNFELSSSITDLLIKEAKKLHVSLYAFYLSIFAILIYFFSNQKKFLIGIPLANRKNQQTQNIMGFLANTLVLNINIDLNQNLSDFIKYNHKNILKLIKLERFPYSSLHKISTNNIHNSEPIFKVMFGYQELENKKFNIKELNIERINFNTIFSKFDISLFMFQKGKQHRGLLECRSHIFSKKESENFYRYFSNICRIAKNTNILIKNIQFYENNDIKFAKNLLKNLDNLYLNKKILEKLEEFNIKNKKFSILDTTYKQVPINIPGILFINHHNTYLKVRLTYDKKLNLIEDNKKDQSNIIENKYHDFIKANSKTEKILENIWKSLLRLNSSLSIHQSFFSIGGHSILVAKMVNNINKKFNIVISIRDIFLHPTISHIASKIESLKEKEIHNTNINPQNLKNEDIVEIYKDINGKKI